ncbi:helix-turn-helix transcriptional regulator [Capnocytophaga granulosa]|uniref:helix-turn-helix domain-containing protein n=1 Tax=Capnocytophaga granulosa TaxID=45242 RepID=UPI0028D22118|nr:helix-turn-helix transcriptional regulator [Capnocytophaga granulosa]
MKIKIENILTKIREIRKKKGYKQAAIAEELGISQSTYAKIEKGQQKLSLETFLSISQILSVTPTDIL